MDFLNVSQFAALMHVSKKRAYVMLAQGLAPSVKIGGRIHIPRAAWDAWCAEQTQKALAAVVGSGAGSGAGGEAEAMPHAS